MPFAPESFLEPRVSLLRFGLLVPVLPQGHGLERPFTSVLGILSPFPCLRLFMFTVLQGTHERAASNRTEVHSTDPPHNASHSNYFSFLFNVHVCSMYTCKYACSHMCVCAYMHVSVETQGWCHDQSLSIWLALPVSSLQGSLPLLPENMELQVAARPIYYLSRF